MRKTSWGRKGSMGRKRSMDKKKSTGSRKSSFDPQKDKITDSGLLDINDLDLQDDEYVPDTVDIVFKSGPLGFHYEGFIVMGIVSDSQANTFGVLPGWRIAKVNGNPQVNNSVTIRRSIENAKIVGKTVTVTFCKSMKKELSLAPSLLGIKSRGEQYVGIITMEVHKGRPAEVGGLKAGDIITHLNDVFVDDHSKFTKIYTRHKPGDTILATVVRGWNRKTTTIRMIVGAQGFTQRQIEIIKRSTITHGVELEGVTKLEHAKKVYNLMERTIGIHVRSDPQRRGVSITTVIPNGPAEVAGLQNTNIISSIRGIRIKNSDEFFSVFNKLNVGETITCKVSHFTGPSTISKPRKVLIQIGAIGYSVDDVAEIYNLVHGVKPSKTEKKKYNDFSVFASDSESSSDSQSSDSDSGQKSKQKNKRKKKHKKRSRKKSKSKNSKRKNSTERTISEKKDSPPQKGSTARRISLEDDSPPQNGSTARRIPLGSDPPPGRKHSSDPPPRKNSSKRKNSTKKKSVRKNSTKKKKNSTKKRKSSKGGMVQKDLLITPPMDPRLLKITQEQKENSTDKENGKRMSFTSLAVRKRSTDFDN